MNVKEKPILFNLAKEAIEQNHQRYLERIALYAKLGIDQAQIRLDITRAIDINPQTILEIGTGKGYLSSCLARIAQKKVVSIDINKEEQKIAALNAAYENLLDKIEFCCLDAQNLPFQDNAFDLVISGFSFHHFEKPFAVIKEMIRLTNSSLIITDFNQNGFNIISKIHKKEGKHHEKKGGDFNIVGTYLKEYGFQVRAQEDTWQKMYIAKKRK